jgi:recombination protein RecT
MSVPKRDATGQIIKNGPAADAGPAATAEKKPPPSLKKLLLGEKMQREIQRAMPKHVPGDRMIRIVLTALSTTRNLSLCAPETFLGCVLQAAQLGLEPNTPLGHCYLIPRRNRALSERLGFEYYACTLMIGYPGMIDLAYRSGHVHEIGAQAVREGDFFEYEYGLQQKLRFKPSEEGDREDVHQDPVTKEMHAAHPITHVWAKATIKSGGQPFQVLSRAQVERRRARSGSSEEGPWVTDYEAMVQKTAIRALWKFVPKSAEMATAEALDVALETGGKQSNVFDDTVQAVLAKQGLEPLVKDDDEEPSPPQGEERGN